MELIGKHITLAAVLGIHRTEGAQRTRVAGTPAVKEKDDGDKDQHGCGRDGNKSVSILKMEMIEPSVKCV